MDSYVTDKEGLLKLEDQLCFALYSASRAITKQYKVLLKEIGVTYPQYLALMVLWQKDGILIQELASALELESATTTPLVQRLEKLELVKRQRSAEDERRVHIFLTDKGRQQHQKALEIPHALGCATGLNEERATLLINEMKSIKSFIDGSR
ncbi:MULTISPECIES: MarR family winged helix-turn-helix transcriptional regulator [Marinomonas]|uniref:MarR family winged helix-turn-helix transcriptional regulator n=1 Tax=Marinomonas TaxID=28253 RepID=UPI0010559313|nr:MarR family transcriptional regulator [Marinomonas flavescens]